MSRKTICTCDRCGQEIADGVVYTLTCYAEDANQRPWGMSGEATSQNMRQNFLLSHERRDLCKACKDALTDGMFIV